HGSGPSLAADRQTGPGFASTSPFPPSRQAAATPPAGRAPHPLRLPVQIAIFLFLTALVAILTWLHCRKAPRAKDDAKEYFLANSGLNWVLIAGSITLTNINTDTIVGWNGNQMFLITWWEF